MRSVFILCVAAVGCAVPEAADGPVGTVRLALGADECTRFCAAVTRAELYRVGEALFPLGPAVQAECGQPMSFEGLPAGTRVFATLEVFDHSGVMRLSGRSDDVTIIDGADADAEIALSGTIVPRLDEVSPDPVVAVTGPAEVELVGNDLAEQGEVTLGDAPLAVDWDTYSATIPSTSDGGPLVVTSCGIPSEPRFLRVVGPTFGRAPIPTVPGCDVAALAPEDDALLVAFDCGASSSFVQRFADGACPLDGDEIWSLPGTPSALAPGWVGLVGGGLARFDGASAGAAVPHAGGAVTALVRAGAIVYGISDGELVRVDDPVAPVAGIDVGYTLIDLGAVGDTAAVLASSGGEARLIEIAPGIDPLTRSASLCSGPRGFAIDQARWVVACDEALVVVDRASNGQSEIALAGERVVLDPRGGIAFVWSVGDALHVVDLEAEVALHAWAEPSVVARPLLVTVAAPLARLVATTPSGGLEAWTPYAVSGPCP